MDTKDKKEKIFIFDTTLRDGEQAAGSHLGSLEKLEIARQLARLKIDVLEVGFPASSPEDFKAVELISKEIEGPIICALSRAVKEDIDSCSKALAPAKKSGFIRVLVFLLSIWKENCKNQKMRFFVWL